MNVGEPLNTVNHKNTTGNMSCRQIPMSIGQNEAFAIHCGAEDGWNMGKWEDGINWSLLPFSECGKKTHLCLVIRGEHHHIFSLWLRPSHPTLHSRQLEDDIQFERMITLNLYFIQSSILNHHQQFNHPSTTSTTSTF